jgi:serine/threonine protein kinase
MGVRKMRTLLNRTLKNEFEELHGVSSECHALLVRMLEPEPTKRASIQDIMRSEWFKDGISSNVAAFNDKVVSQLKKQPRVTEDTVLRVRKILRGGDKSTITPHSGISRGSGI